MVSFSFPLKPIVSWLTVLACNNTLEYGPAVQVFYKAKVITTPAGCSDVELVVEYV